MIDWLRQEIASCEQWIDHLNANGRYNDTAFNRGILWAYKEILKRLLEAEQDAEKGDDCQQKQK